jgi:hypothetical protein
MKLLGVLCAICGCCLSAAGLDREALTFTRYDLEVRIEPEQQRLGVRGKVTVRNDSEAAQANATLQISSTLNWSSIRLEGKPIEFISQTYTSDIDHTGALTEAIIALPKAVAPKQTITLEIGYEGVIPQDTTRLTRIGVPSEVAKHTDWDQIGPSFTAVRGIGNVAWYPIATEAANLSQGNSVLETIGRWKQREAEAEMKINFAHSGDAVAGLPTLFCNGEGQPAGHEQVGRAYVSHSECTLRNLDSLVPLFVVGNFQAVDRSEVNISYLSDHSSAASDYALAADEIVPFITKWFGDHRVKSGLKAEVIELPDRDAAPFESGNVLLIPLSGNENAMLMSAIQQLTHSFFPSSRAWVRDGLAHYAQVSFVADKEGRDAALEYLRNHSKALIESEKLAPAEPNQAAHSLINSDDEFYVQSKAMNVWWMLREIVGGDALSAALHNYKSGDDKTADYLEKLVEAQTHRDLAWFFDDWVYRDRGLPDFRIASVYPRELVNGGYMVTVNVENTGQAAAEVPVTLKVTTGERTERLVVPGKSTASVRIVCTSFPQQATVNDGSVLESDTNNNVYKIER